MVGHGMTDSTVHKRFEFSVSSIYTTEYCLSKMLNSVEVAYGTGALSP